MSSTSNSGNTQCDKRTAAGVFAPNRSIQFPCQRGRWLCRYPGKVDDLKDHAILRYLLGLEPYPIPFADGSTLLGDGPFDANNGAGLKQAAVSGAGIAYMMLEDEIASGRSVRVLPDVPLAKVPVCVLHAYGKMLPGRIRLFTDFMVEQTKAMLSP